MLFWTNLKIYFLSWQSSFLRTSRSQMKRYNNYSDFSTYICYPDLMNIKFTFFRILLVWNFISYSFNFSSFAPRLTVCSTEYTSMKLFICSMKRHSFLTPQWRNFLFDVSRYIGLCWVNNTRKLDSHRFVALIAIKENPHADGRSRVRFRMISLLSLVDMGMKLYIYKLRECSTQACFFLFLLLIIFPLHHRMWYQVFFGVSMYLISEHGQLVVSRE